MIRASVPEDTPEIERLCIAQFIRTPWPPDGAVASDVHVCFDREDRMVGAVLFARAISSIYVIHVWTIAGFAGRRAAVALLKDLANMADAEEMTLTFTVAMWNRGLRSAVERFGCVVDPSVTCVDPSGVYYARSPVPLRLRA
jgi:hypothetical protein